MQVVETIYDAKRQRRVHIFQRPDGTFGFEEERYSDLEFEHCWIPISWGGVSFCDTFETAVREAYGRVDWLIPSFD